jgi:tetratricopeptide (TPR) repeat protein
MSFETRCPKCGAPSSPSTGTCPFCHEVFTSSSRNTNISLANLLSKYDSGDLPAALSSSTLLEKQSPELLTDADFLLAYLKILIDTDGPTYKMQNLVTNGLKQNKMKSEFVLFSEIVDAIECLHGGLFQDAEAKLQHVLSLSPEQPQALFLYGTHLFYNRQNLQEAINYLEKCVQISPKFIRAWGCLGVIYESLKNKPLATRAYQKCLEFEKEPTMNKFFTQHLEGLTNS